ncbi:MAG: protoheme IX farnesyltransferase [Chlamydiae bacterium]|nr:protoheme IX farnesyltransferase [Chlamydiota bacterium]
MIKTYLSLTKPGIIFGNAITAAAGFALASKGHFNFGLFLATLVGISLIIGSACVFNNYIDRIADEKMTRTKNRALATGLVSIRSAILFGISLGVLGTFTLSFYTNLLTVLVATAGFFVYVVLYSNLKYRSIYGTIIGSIAGAVPPVVGYCAVSNIFDTGAFILFLLISLWQMPHFFAIAMYRFDDYAAASIPVLPIVKGMHTTKVHMLLYVIAFTLTTLMLTVFGYTGYAYLTITGLVCLTWLILCIKGFTIGDDKLWAKSMFRFSLIVVMALSAMIAVDVVKDHEASAIALVQDT